MCRSSAGLRALRSRATELVMQRVRMLKDEPGRCANSVGAAASRREAPDHDAIDGFITRGSSLRHVT
jgi:hypothetical protein